MSLPLAKPKTIGTERRALNHLLAEFERARTERDAAEMRVTRFEETIQLVLATIPEPDRGDLAAKFEELKSGAQSRGSAMFGNVVSLFKSDRKRAWTVPEVQEELQRSGVSPDPKAVANVVNYLAKTGRLTRISRGQYIVAGVGVEIEVPDQGTHRPTEHDW